MEYIFTYVRRYDCIKRDEVNTDIELSAEEEAAGTKRDMMPEPDYVAVIANNRICDQPYEDMTIGNVNREPHYEGVTVFTTKSPDPEYETVTNYRKQDATPRAPVYANTLDIKGARRPKK